MRKIERMLTLATIVGMTLFGASTLYARDNQDSSGSMMGGGMMGRGNMTGRMSRMMEYCGGMMQGAPRSNRPNDQWRKNKPSEQDNK